MFYIGSDNKLRHSWLAPDTIDWSPEETLGGSLASDPAAVSWGSGRIDVFARGTDNALKHLWYQAGTGAGWQPWESLGGNLTSAPAVASWGAGRLDVFALGTNSSLKRRAYQAGLGAGWQDWEDLGGNWTSAPDAVSWGPNRIDVVVQGADKFIHQTVLLTGASYDEPVTGAYAPELSALDTVMKKWMHKYGFHAATLAVLRDNALVYERGYGYQDKNLTTEILPHARMRLATYKPR